MKKIFTISIIITLLGCNRQPEANFSVSEIEVFEGDEIKFYNESKKGKSFLWDFDNGNTSNEENPKYTYHKYGVYSVKLGAYSRNEKKLDEYITKVKVKNILRQKIIGEWKLQNTTKIVYKVSDGKQVEAKTEDLTNAESTLNFNDNSKVTGYIRNAIVDWFWSITSDDKIIINNQIIYNNRVYSSNNEPANINVTDNDMYIKLVTKIDGYSFHYSYYFVK